jgi:magnesium transporter
MSDNQVYRASTGWEWFTWDEHRSMDYPINNEDVQRWWKESRSVTHNQIITAPFRGSDNKLSGTLVISQNPGHSEEMNLLHYFVTKNKLITIGLHHFLHKIKEDAFKKQILGCSSPIESFLFIINEIVDKYFEWMDRFELVLTEAKVNMRKTNGGHLFNTIMDLRYNLLLWNAQMIPIKEIRFAAEEVFSDTVTNNRKFKTLQLRMERVNMLQNEYAEEIDSLLKLDDVTINYRANDIMKTLTVFTVMLTPMTALGAIWGMNFEQMPELKWRWGYFTSLGVIFILTVSIYWWLRKQGWTGNILKASPKRKRSQP